MYDNEYGDKYDRKHAHTYAFQYGKNMVSNMIINDTYVPKLDNNSMTLDEIMNDLQLRFMDKRNGEDKNE